MAGERVALRRLEPGAISPWFAIPLLVYTLCCPAAAPDLADAAPSRSPLTIMITGYRLPTTIEEAPGSVTVIDRTEIEARQPPSVVELLRLVPGLHIDQPGGRGGVSSVYLRGGDPNFALVLIDGIKVNDPTNSRGGSFDFSALEVSNIERVEILRGPLSSIYGSDAIAGVINIITRRPGTRPGAYVEAGYGMRDYATVAAGFDAPVGDAALSGNAGYTDAGKQVDGSRFIGRNLALNGVLYLQDATSLRLFVQFADSDVESFPDDSGGPEFAVIRDVEGRDNRQLMAGMDLERDLSGPWRFSAKANVYDLTEEVRSPGVAPGLRDPFGIPPNSSNNRFTRYTGGASAIMQPANTVKGILGFEAQLEEGTSEGELDFGSFAVPTRFHLDRALYALFAEVEYTTPLMLSLQAGLRADFPEGFDTEVSPRIGAVYRTVDTGTTLRASWGKGFKLPSFFALANPIVGNPGLRPETSESVDFGVAQTLFDAMVQVGVTAFYNRFMNLIDLDEDPPPRLVNRSEVTARGVELTLTAKARDTLTVNANLTYLDTDIKGTGEELRNRPKWRGGIDLRWYPRDDVTANLDAFYVGKVLDQVARQAPSFRAGKDSARRGGSLLGAV